MYVIVKVGAKYVQRYIKSNVGYTVIAWTPNLRDACCIDEFAIDDAHALARSYNGEVIPL